MDKGEMKKCSFCSLSILKSDIKKHTEFHILQWEADDEVKEELLEETPQIINTTDIKKENMTEECENTKEMTCEDNVQCSFCSKFINKSDVKNHIHQHVLEWDDKEDDDDPSKEVSEKDKRTGSGDTKAMEMETDNDLENENATEENTIVEIKSLDNEERVKCSFCPELICKSDVKEHVQNHVLEWGEDEDKDDPDKEMLEETLIAEDDDGTDLQLIENVMESMTHEAKDGVVKENTQRSVKCSFCPEFFQKSDMKDHIEHHVLEWDKDMDENDMTEEISDSGKHEVEPVNDQDPDSSDKNQTNIMEDQTIEYVQAAEEGSEQSSVKCSFCPDMFEKAVIKEHIEQHVLEWNEDEVKNSHDKEISEETEHMESEYAVNEKEMKESVIEENGSGKATEVKQVKCSFCVEIVLKSDISKHILSHTLEWGDVVDDKSEDEKKISEKKNISEEKNKTSKYESDENLQDDEIFQESQNLKMSEDLFKCPLCEKLIPKLSKLEHAKKHVKTQPKNNCKHCGKNFLLKWVLEEHDRLHTGEKPIQCASCEKSFRAKQGLYIHVKTHHTKTLTTKCDPCWKTSKGIYPNT